MSMYRPDWLDDNLFPYQSHTIDLLEARLHYVDEGHGPTLLMLHGNPTWSFLYRHVIADLRPDFRCIALDYPGMGLSTAPPDYGFTPSEHAAVVEAFILARDLHNVILIGQDWGGPIGLAVALAHPDRFAGFVLGNTFARPLQGGMHGLFATLMGGAVARFFILRFNAFIPLIHMGTSRTRPPADVMQHYYGPYPTPDSRWPTYVFPRELQGSHTFLAEIEERLPRLAYHPALLAWGERDILLGARSRAQFEDVFARHHTVILKGANHFIQEDAPHDLAAAIRQWWEHIEPTI